LNPDPVVGRFVAEATRREPAIFREEHVNEA